MFCNGLGHFFFNLATWIWNRILFLAPIQINTYECLGAPGSWSILTTPIICFRACEASNEVWLCVLWKMKYHTGRNCKDPPPRLVCLTFLKEEKDNHCSPIQCENLTETTAYYLLTKNICLTVHQFKQVTQSLRNKDTPFIVLLALPIRFAGPGCIKTKINVIQNTQIYSSRYCLYFSQWLLDTYPSKNVSGCV